MKKTLVLISIPFLLGGCAGLKGVPSTEVAAPSAERLVSSMDKDLLIVYLKKGDFTGAQLRKLAVEKGIIPNNVGPEYYQQHKKERNTGALWIIYSREEKIALIDSFKRIFRFRGAVVSRDSKYFVDRINNVLYQRIRKDQFDISRDKGIINIFKTIAILEGDYDDGRKKVVILRQWLGEKGFEEFRRNYPERYNQLLRGSQ